MAGLFDLAVSGMRGLLGPAPNPGLLSGLSNEDIARAMEWQQSVMRNYSNQVPYTPQQVEADRLARWASAGGNSPADVRKGGLLSMGLTPQRYDQAMMWGGLAPMAATVFHGSPHKFNKFDASKIGTGEGVQAYGHGLYFAENPSIARGYAERLGDVKWQGRWDDSPTGMAMRLVAPEKVGGAGLTRDSAIRELERRASGSTDSGFKQRMQDGIAWLRSNPSGHGDNRSLYKVDLPDEAIAKMLDWDKPLSQQPEILAKLKDSLSGMYMPAEHMTGANIIKALEDKGWVMDKYGRGQAGVTNFLRAQGIPGIRYLDQGSRGAGQGTYNYVVFPGGEDMLKILNRE